MSAHAKAADWLIGEIGTPKVSKKALERVEREVLDPVAAAKEIASATERAHKMAVGVAESGLTGDTLVELIISAAPSMRNGNKPSAEAVRATIRGMLHLGDHLR